VIGEVTVPGMYAVSRVNGDPRKAILAAGGAKEEAALTRVRLIRATQPEPIILDLTPGSKETLPEAAQQLEEGDILVVPARQAVILGAVASPGPVPLRGDETLMDILPARVGEGSDVRHILVVRAENVKKDRDEREEYDLEEYFKKGKADIVVPIYDGDLVYVPAKDRSGGFFGKFTSIFSVLGMARWFF